MPTAEIVWAVPPSTLANVVSDMRESFYEVLEVEMQSAADELLMWMVANHPWTNRTYEAENSLVSETRDQGETVIIENAAPHGIWLEFKHGGRWGVIRPALSAAGPIFRRGMENVVKEVLSG